MSETLIVQWEVKCKDNPSRLIDVELHLGENPVRISLSCPIQKRRQFDDPVRQRLYEELTNDEPVFYCPVTDEICEGLWLSRYCGGDDD